ncbi:MAG: dTMP kinase [Gammaproteobacteria bacterium]|jgi:dTMP kinase|nr:dTMP kinase [Gammaproteobacteria bacterium]MBT5051715.1 dTMP kinase [Gammaproteobacteria bacterium]MDC0464826.1 dTMP kinase [Pseudomonadales bacterium]
MVTAAPRGQFITLEGTEGVGKSSLMTALSEWLAAKGESVVTTREPGGTATGEALRSLLLDPSNQNLSDLTELGLMFAARSQHIFERIEPALARGDWVICDRFTDSTYAYQGGGRGISLALIAQFEAVTLDGFTPNLTILLDVPVATGLARAAQVSAPDRFESEQHAFFERARETFLRRAETQARTKIVDASQSQANVKQSVVSLIEQHWISVQGDHP